MSMSSRTVQDSIRGGIAAGAAKAGPRSTQDKFRDLLALECQSRGLELIVNTEWGNTGQYAIHGSALAPLLVIRYGWQSNGGVNWRGGGYVTLTPDKPIPGFHGRSSTVGGSTFHYADLDTVLRSILSLFAPSGGKLR